MKKLSFLLIIVCILLAACELSLPEPEPEEEQHVHTWNDGYYTVLPTCQTDGEKICACLTCDETKTFVVKASDQFHEFGNGEETKAPTCTEKGERLFTCALCQATKTIQTDELGHIWDEGKITKDATEEEEGEITYTCTREGCNATRTESYHLHLWGSGSETKPATCTTDGEITYTCSVCGETKTETIPADGTTHSYSTAWQSDDTYHWHENTCEHVLTHDQMDSYAEHTFGEPVVTAPATCTTEGTREKTCTVCGYKVTESFTDETVHTFSTEWSADENQHWHAATCAHEVTPVKENHTWGEPVVTKEGTCTEDGEQKLTCSVCGYSVTESIPKEEYHDYDTGNNTCKKCGDVCYFQAQYTQNKVMVTLRAAFYSSGLKDLIIPEYVPSLNYKNIYKAEVIRSVPLSTLESIVIPDGVTTIGNQAFRGLANLHTVDLPDTLTTIEQEAFFECRGLETIHIPASVTFIGAQGLAYCTSLTDIYFEGTKAQWATLLSSASNILKGTTATVHCSDD